MYIHVNFQGVGTSSRGFHVSFNFQGFVTEARPSVKLPSHGNGTRCPYHKAHPRRLGKSLGEMENHGGLEQELKLFSYGFHMVFTWVSYAFRMIRKFYYIDMISNVYAHI